MIEAGQIKQLYLAYVSGFFQNNYSDIKWLSGPTYIEKTRVPFCRWIEEGYQENPLFTIPGETWKDWMAEALIREGIEPV